MVDIGLAKVVQRAYERMTPAVQYSHQPETFSVSMELMWIGIITDLIVLFVHIIEDNFFSNGELVIQLTTLFMVVQDDLANTDNHWFHDIKLCE